MKRKRFSIEQIVAVLKQAELGMPVVDVIRQVGISEQTFYRWKKPYAGMQSDHVRELKQLQEENARLKKLVTSPRPFAKYAVAFDRISISSFALASSLRSRLFSLPQAR